MRPTSHRRGPVRPRPSSPADEDGWTAGRVRDESARVLHRLTQLEAAPWWRVSERELDELDARLAALEARSGHAPRG